MGGCAITRDHCDTFIYRYPSTLKKTPFLNLEYTKVSLTVTALTDTVGSSLPLMVVESMQWEASVK